MALTPFRWIAVSIAACLIVAVVIFNEERTGRVYDRGPERHLTYREELHAQHAGAAARRFQFARLLDSVRASATQVRDTSSIRVLHAAALPLEGRVALDSLAARAVRPVRDSGHVGIDIVFLYDTVSKVRGVSVSRYGTSVDYVLPRRVSERCTVVAHVPKNPAIRVQIARIFRTEAAAQELLGPCAYYRAFGLPGSSIDAWLRELGWSFAGDGAWNRSILQVDLAAIDMWDVPSVFQAVFGASETSARFLNVAGVEAVQCALGQADDCDRAVLVGGQSRRSPRFWQGNVLLLSYPNLGGRDWWYYDRRGLGIRESFLLAGMVRTLGRERFARFWSSNEPVPTAFATAAGEPLSHWTSRWIIEQYGPVPPRGPGVNAWAGALSAALIGLAIFVALRISAHRQFI